MAYNFLEELRAGVEKVFEEHWDIDDIKELREKDSLKESLTSKFLWSEKCGIYCGRLDDQFSYSEIREMVFAEDNFRALLDVFERAKETPELDELRHPDRLDVIARMHAVPFVVNDFLCDLEKNIQTELKEQSMQESKPAKKPEKGITM